METEMWVHSSKQLGQGTLMAASWEHLRAGHSRMRWEDALERKGVVPQQKWGERGCPG